MGRGLIDRFERYRRRHGLLKMPRRLAEFGVRWFRNSHHVFRWDPSSPPCESPEGLSISLIASPSELTPLICAAIRAEGGSERTVEQELSNHGVLWVATIHGDLAAYQFSREAAHIRRWFLELRPRDIVLFSFVTFERWKGKGIAPAMARYIASSSSARAGTSNPMDCYVDCKVWNKASIRALTKAGFVRIATMKSLEREDELGLT